MMRKFTSYFIFLIQTVLIGGIFATLAFADTDEVSTVNSGRILLQHKNDMIVAEIDKAPLSSVVKEIETRTGTHFILKDPSIANYPLSIKIKGVTLEEALKRIFKNFSYVAYSNGGGDINKVLIFGAKTKASDVPDEYVVDSLLSNSKPQPIDASQQLNGEETSLAKTEDPLDGDELAEYESPQVDADIPQDLDDFQPLLEELSDEAVGELDPEQLDPEAQQFAMEELESREEYFEQQRLERSVRALNSEYVQLRLMAVEELACIQDPLVTTTLADVANGSKGLSSDVRRMAAEALWHQAADYQFANESANTALAQMAKSDDTEVRAIANKALDDMRRYLQRY